jgi:signal transduction histidine kinase
MILKIALIISVILQGTAAAIALTLVKRTRKNVAWWLITLAFLLMAIRRVIELYLVFGSENPFINSLFSSWIGVAISLVLLVSLVFIKQIFNIQARMDALRKDTERRVLSAIIHTEETERKHFAKELHDGLGPILSSIKMSLSALKQPENEHREEILENTGKLVNEAIASIRETSNKLSPHLLKNFGIVRAIQAYLKTIKRVDHPVISFNTNLEGQRFSESIETALFRICGELLNNTLRHANARHIGIDLYQENKLLTLDYFDDGKGFDPALAQKKSEGMGLSNIRSRVKSANGRLEIESQIGEGMHCRVEFDIIQNEK